MDSHEWDFLARDSVRGEVFMIYWPLTPAAHLLIRHPSDARMNMSPALPPDYHTHTARCGHATGSASDYVEAARSRGLSGIGISDHLPLLHTPTPVDAWA